MIAARRVTILRWLMALLALLAMAHNTFADDEPLPPDQAFRYSARVVSPRQIEVRFDIADGYYMYREKFRFVSRTDGVSVGPASLPAGHMKEDETFGRVETYRGPVVIGLPVRAPAGAGELALETVSQGCADAGLCYTPQKHLTRLLLTAGSSAEAATADGGDVLSKLRRSPAASPPPAEASVPVARALGKSAAVTAAAPEARAPAVPAVAAPSALPPPVAATEFSPAPAVAPSPAGDESASIARLMKSGNFWLILFSFFGFGLLLSFTPCVLPMVPILSGIIIGQGHKVTRGHALALSGVYVIGMAVTYALAGVAAGLSGTLLANALQNPWVLGAFALVFVLLSLSMFGFYELQLPAALQSRLTDSSNKMKGGTFWGVFIMGVLSALIVGPCVAAPLAGALLYINKSRDALLGGGALFAMALGMGVPLMAVGASAGALMPRAGAWMQTVKNFFGVVLLGLAIWIVSPIVPAVLHMLMWAGLLICSAVYLHAIDPLPHHTSGFRKLWKGIGVIALLVGVALLVGALSGGRDLLQPLSGLRAGAAGGESGAEGPQFQHIASIEELDRALGQAGGRPVMLDFYADWCSSCKEMERFTFTDPAVRVRMGKLLLLKADVTGNTPDDTALLKRFGLFGPPGTIFFDARGRELPTPRVIGFQTAERFGGVLDMVLAGK